MDIENRIQHAEDALRAVRRRRQGEERRIESYQDFEGAPKLSMLRLRILESQEAYWADELSALCREHARQLRDRAGGRGP